jgi:hypothetical protein
MLKPLDLAVLEAKVATLMKGAASSLLPDATTTGETQ